MTKLHLYFLLMVIWSSFSCQPSANELPANKPESQDTSSSLPFASLDQVIGLHQQSTDGLDSMIQRRRIRALVPYSSMHYFIDGTERSGLCYDAMRSFEEFLNARLQSKHKIHIVFIPTAPGELFDKLEQGYGDLIAMGLTQTPYRSERFAFSSPIMSDSKEVIVSGPSSRLSLPSTTIGQEAIYVRASSSYYEHLQMINDSLQSAGLPNLNLRLIDESVNDEQLLAMINEGILPATLMEYNLATFWSKTMDKLTIHPELTLFSGGRVAYLMRKQNPALKQLVDAFVKQNKKGTLLGNILYNKYLQDTTYLTKAYTSEVRQRISQTRSLFLKYGEQYDLDWLLLAALAYQESKLNQAARSHAGAVGIMQVRPSTARDANIGINDVYQLEPNIHAGTKYLRFLIDNYFIHPEIDSLNAGLFALAAYNAGPFRVQKLRKEAQRQGLNPMLWFNHVELIAAQQIGRETVEYVSNIYKFYTSYRALLRYTQEYEVVIFDDE
jgi:membrane-bound lytic murein transglycosylase MltF